MLRRTAYGLALIATSLLAACGDDDETPVVEGVRVLIRTSASDGPVQGDLFLRKTEGEREQIALRRLEGDVWIADGAPNGYYRIASTEGWQHLWPSAMPPMLYAGEQPNHAWLGRPNTLYLGPAPGSVHAPGLEWFVQRVEGRDGAGVEIPVEIFDQEVVDLPHPHVALRFTTETWVGTFRALGRMRDGALCEPVVISLPIDNGNRPRLHHVRPARAQPLVTTLVRTDPQQPVPDGTLVTATLIGLPIDEVYEARTHGEIAYFPEVAVAGNGVRVSFGASARAHVISNKTWRRLGATYLLAPDAKAVRVPLEGLDPWAERMLMIRMDRGDRYGLAAIDVDGVDASVRAPVGRQRWLLRLVDAAGKAQWASLDVDVQAGADTRVRVGDLQRGCTVKGNVHAVPTLGYRLLFFRDEGDGEADIQVLGHGFDVSISHTGSFEADLPPGSYRVSILEPSGREQAQEGVLQLTEGVQVRRSFTYRPQ